MSVDQRRLSSSRRVSEYVEERTVLSEAVDQIVEILQSDHVMSLASGIVVLMDLFQKALCELYGHDREGEGKVCGLCGEM